MKTLHELTRFYKAGGGGGGQVAASPTPAPPPASTSGAEATQARLDAAQQLKRRKGVNSTLLQGSAGASQANDSLTSAPKGNVLLGGG